MRYGVVIVNWNGAVDTGACLRSLAASLPCAVPIVVDNGSTDDSLSAIASALDALGATAARLDAAQLLSGPARPFTRPAPALDGPPAWRGAGAIVVEAYENLGFAAGCNLGLAVADAAGLAVTVILNNDTIVEDGALDSIVARLVRDERCFACLPMLTVAGTDRIWNCGGSVWRVGLRRYHLAGRPRREGAARSELDCTFFTGCCFAIRTADFVERGGWSERFFFGEEDFELSLWMKARDLKAICLTSAVVGHKVSASFERAAGGKRSAKAFVYYLNRFIHMRLRLGDRLWRWWVAAYLPYAAALLLGKGVVRAGLLPTFVSRLLIRSKAMDRVTRTDFEALMREWPA